LTDFTIFIGVENQLFGQWRGFQVSVAPVSQRRSFLPLNTPESTTQYTLSGMAVAFWPLDSVRCAVLVAHPSKAPKTAKTPTEPDIDVRSLLGWVAGYLGASLMPVTGSTLSAHI